MMMTNSQALLAARYGSHSNLPEQLIHNSVVDQMLAHRSVRAFVDTPLPTGTLETLVAAAQSAATSSNLQSWSVVAIEDSQRRARISEWANGQQHIRVAPLFLAWIADLSRIDRIALDLEKPSEANRYLEMFLVASIDAALAAQNATLAAESLGLGTVYIGALRNHPAKVSAELKLPARAFALFGLCVGYPDPARPTSVKPRLGQRTIVHHEQYSTNHETQEIAHYNKVMNEFQAAQGLPAIAWTQQAGQRVAGIESLSGRQVLRAEIYRQGFEIE